MARDDAASSSKAPAYTKEQLVAQLGEVRKEAEKHRERANKNYKAWKTFKEEDLA